MPKFLPAVFRFTFVASVVFQLAGCSGSPEQRAQRHYEQGKDFLAKNDDVKAMIEFKNALQLKGDLVDAWRGLAQVEERKQDWATLFKLLPKIIELDPKDVDALLRFARLQLLANKLDDALKTVDTAAQLDAGNTGARVLRAAILLKLHDSKGAVQDAHAALKADPGNVDAYIVLAAERFDQGDNDGALAVLDKVGTSDKDNLGVQLFRLKVYERKGDLQRVESLLLEFIKAHPQEKLYRRMLVKLYVDQKRPADAERELRAIAAARPDDHEAGLDVVRYVFSTKGAAAAQQELVARTAGGKEVFEYQIALADLYFTEGKVEDAKQLLEKLSNSGTVTADQALLAQSKLAELHFKTKNLEAAESLVSKILEKDGRNAQALHLRASIHLARGDASAAVADLRQALHDQPRSADLNSLLAVAYERAGSIELADKQYADTLRLSNLDARAGLNYVAFLRRRGALDRAEDTLVELASHSPSNVEILSALAEVRLARRNWAGAQEVADVIRRSGDKRGIADQVLGAALAGQQKYDQSISVLQSAYAAAPDDAQPMYAFVNTLVRAKKLDQATTFLQTVLKRDADNAEALTLMGSVQLIKNAPEEAAKSFREAIARQPNKAVGYRALAGLLLRQKQADEALKVVRDGLKTQPESVTLRLTEAGILEGKEDYEGAIADYELVLKQQPGSLVGANNLASLLTDYRTDRASYDRAYSVALELRESQVPQFKDTLGWVYYRRGEYKTALPYFEAAVAALPDSAGVRYHQAMNLIALGESAKAEEQLTKALDLASGNKSLGEKIKAALQGLPKNG